MFNNMRLFTLFDMLLNPSFKMTASFANTARTTSSTRNFIYQERNGVVIIDRKLYDNAIQEILSDTCTLEKLNEDPISKRKAPLQRFLRKLKKKTRFLIKLNMINCILLVMLLLVSTVLLKCTNSALVVHFLNFVRLFHRQVLLIIILAVIDSYF